MTTNASTQSPISFKANVLRLPRKGMPVAIEADEKQRAALAVEHDLLSVDRLHADLLVVPWKSDGVRVTGHVEAEIAQACVVTLEPVAASIREAIDAIFIPEGSRLAKRLSDPSGEILVDPDGPDAPELFAGDTIDVGALAEEFFALGIDPYPRSSGAAVTSAISADEEPERPVSPFDKLKSLKPEG
ncbi:MAG: YceD family protein [Mesorhizobium sp.]